MIEDTLFIESDVIAAVTDAEIELLDQVEVVKLLYTVEVGLMVL